jgi:putative addiction module component (TIGR02574 family)
MKPVVEDVVRQALKLDEDGRAEVAARLLDSLEQADTEAEAVWLTELERRAAELESEAVQGIPWEDLRERLRDPSRSPARPRPLG